MLKPKEFLQKNYPLIKKRCRDNGMDNPTEVFALLEEIIGKLEVIKYDRDATQELVSKWLSEHYEIEAEVYSDLLFCFIQGNPFYVYATNVIIQRRNRTMLTNIPLRDDKMLNTYVDILRIKNISVFDTLVKSAFPNPKERHEFLFSLFNELSERKTPSGESRLTVSKTMLLKRAKKLMTALEIDLDEKGGGDPKSKLTAGQKALIIYCRYKKLRQEKTLFEIIQEAHDREGWSAGSQKNIKNLYDSLGRGTKKDPATMRNLTEIAGFLSEEELKEALSLVNK